MKKRNVLSILCAAVLAISGTFVALGREYKNSNKTATVDKAPVADNVIIQEEESNAVSLATKKISLDDYEKYSVEPLAESAIELTATVLPEGVVNNGVKWTLSWVNPSSAWATGNKIDDYLTIVPAYENALTAVVSCKQAFGEQAKITVTSCDDATKTATCTVDYVQKIEDVALKFGSVNINLGGETKIKYELRQDIFGPGGEVSADIKMSRVYTIEENIETTVVFEPYLQFGTASAKIFGMANKFYTGNLLGESIFFDYQHDIKNWYFQRGPGDLRFEGLSVEDVIEQFTMIENDQSPSTTLYTVKIVVQGIYELKNYSSDLIYDGYTNCDVVYGLALSKNSLFF